MSSLDRRDTSFKKNKKSRRLNQHKVQNFKIAFYIRVSSENQAKIEEGSLKNQEERLKAYVEARNASQGDFGVVVDTFIDRAKSGKDTNRPELLRLLRKITEGEVDLVMSTELSRISRSIKDFSSIWDLMQENGCGFLSLRENFDSTTAAGEMLLFSMANLAQFERRQISERVKAGINARSKRGLYNGGSVPFGFKLIPDKPGYLAVVKTEAEIIKLAFNKFLEEKSTPKTARRLNENGYSLKRLISGGGRNMRLGYFTSDNLHHILKNKMYKGVKTFKDENGEVKEVKAVWDKIVDEVTFKRVQKIIEGNVGKRKPQSFKKHPYLFSGIIYCGACNSSLSGKSAHGKTKKIPYYEHAWATKRGAFLSKEVLECSGRRRYPARKAEALILDEVKKLINDEGLSKRLYEKALKVYKVSKTENKLDPIKAKISGYDSQLEAMAERLSELPREVSAAPIYKQMKRIEGAKFEAKKSLEALRTDRIEEVAPVALITYQVFLKSIKELLGGENHEMKSKVLKKLIKKVILNEESIEVEFNLSAEMFKGLELIKEKREKEKIYTCQSSQILTNGTPGET